MKYVLKKSEANPIQEPSSTFYEYKLPGKQVCIGVSEIEGRYPESGFEVDEKIEGCWYVEKGSGIIWIDGNEHTLEVGDAVIIPANEKFYIQGYGLRLIVASSPVWYPEQHKHID
jgi:mannose-6-phosphate isomerase-like protein (cupin superfamily)